MLANGLPQYACISLTQSYFLRLFHVYSMQEYTLYMYMPTNINPLLHYV